MRLSDRVFVDAHKRVIAMKLGLLRVFADEVCDDAPVLRPASVPFL
jgi:hypothetical protein